MSAFIFALQAATVDAQLSPIVTPGNLQGWAIGSFSNTGNEPIRGFIQDAAGATAGNGYYETTIDDSDEKIILGRQDYHEQPLANLDSISYQTYYDSTAGTMTNPLQYYVNLYVDANGDGTYDTRLDFVPSQNGTVVADTWQTWTIDDNATVLVSGTTPTTLGDYKANNPNAQLNAFNDPTGLAIRFNMGDTASTYVGFSGWLDDVQITYNSNTVIYDFEPGRILNTTTNETWDNLQPSIDDLDTTDGDTLVAAAGTYVDDVVITKELTLEGANAGVSGFSTRNAESIIYPASTTADGNFGGSPVISLQADNVRIDGFTIDADNPNLSGGFVDDAGVDTDADYLLNNFVTGGEANFTFVNNIGLHAPSTGVYLNGNGYGMVSDNRLSDMRTSIARAIITAGSFYADVTTNTISNVTVGIQTNNMFQAHPNGATTVSISDNDFSVNMLGIYHNLVYQNAPDYSINGNTITVGANPSATSLLRGMQVYSIQNNVGATFDQNTITGFDVGAQFWNNPTTNTVSFVNGTLTNNATGIYLFDCSEAFGQGQPTTVNVSATTITDSSEYAVFVHDNFYPAPTVNPVSTTCSENGTNGEGNPSTAPSLTLDMTATNNAVALRVETQADDPQGAATVPSADVSNSVITAGAQTIAHVQLAGTNSSLAATNVDFDGQQTLANGITADSAGAVVTFDSVRVFDHIDTGMALTNVDTANSSVSNSCFYNNTLFGVNSAVATFDATGNWWGAASGSGGAGPGFGDPINANVNASGFLTTAPTTANGTCGTRSLDIPTGNLIQNGTFAQGINFWKFFGDYDFAFINEELRFYRLNPGWRGAIVFQEISEPLVAGVPVQIDVALGNNSNVPKGVEILLRDTAYNDIISCAVTIPAGNALQTLTIQDVPDANGEAMVFSIRAYDADETPAIRVDDVSVEYLPNSGITEYDCQGYNTPQDTELVRDGGFDTGLRPWLFWGDYVFEAVNGVIEFYNPSGATRPAVLFNNQLENVPENSPLNLTVEVGNSSNVEKSVQIILRTPLWEESFVCRYTIPAGTPLTQIQVQGTTSIHWSRPMISIRNMDADGAPSVRVDNVSLLYQPSLTPATQCSTPNFTTIADTVPDGMKAPTTIMPDGGIAPDNGGAAPAPIAPPNPGGIPEIPGF